MKMIWRERERNIALPAMPSAWKKLVDTTWNPTIQKDIVVMRMQFTAHSICDSSCMNMAAMALGLSAPMMLPSEVITTPDAAASQNVLNSRW